MIDALILFALIAWGDHRIHRRLRRREERFKARRWAELKALLEPPEPARPLRAPRLPRLPRRPR